MFNWYLRLSVVAIIARLGSTQSLPSVIKKAGCEFHISRNGNLGKISHSTKKRCVYSTRTLANLSSDVMVFNTASLNCRGSSGGVFFPTDPDKDNTENFCIKTDCLAYTRRGLRLRNDDVLTAIGDTFSACKKYEVIKKPAALKFKALKGIDSFTLQYAIFNMTVPPTYSTDTITSGSVLKLRVQVKKQAQTTPRMSAETTQKMSAETTARTSAETTRKMSRQETKHTAATAGFGNAVRNISPHITPVSEPDAITSLKTDPNVNKTGQEMTSKKKTETKPWHYALPISLGTLLAAGVSILGICRRRTNTRMKGIVVAKYVATHLSESRENVNQKPEEVEESTLLT